MANAETTQAFGTSPIQARSAGDPPADGGSLIRQTALFGPVGVGGLLYWYGLWGIHQMVFAGMLRNIARDATTSEVMAPCERTR